MLLTSMLFGLLPAVRGSRTEIALSLKDRSGALSSGGLSLRRVLVGIQVALSLLLLVGAGLFVRTLGNLESLGPGFPTDHLLTFRIDPSLNGYSDEQTKSFYQRLNINLQTMPGVTSVGFSAMPILKGYAWQNAVLGKDFEGAPIEAQSTSGPTMAYRCMLSSFKRCQIVIRPLRKRFQIPAHRPRCTFAFYSLPFCSGLPAGQERREAPESRFGVICGRCVYRGRAVGTCGEPVPRRRKSSLRKTSSAGTPLMMSRFRFSRSRE
jgi:hypothetical protein